MQTQTTKMQILEFLLDSDWSRKSEIQAMIPEKKQRTIENAISQLKKNQEISEFILPDYYGLAYKLTDKGYESIISRLDLAGEYDKFLQKKTNKNKEEGNFVNKLPKHWMHNLIARNALISLSINLKDYEDVEIIFENTIRRDYPNLPKIPDGIIIFSGGYIWLEVENIRKKGNKLLKLCKTLIQFNDSQLPSLYGHQCTDVVVAYISNNDYSVHDIKQKIYETAVGDYTFKHLPIEAHLGKMRASAPLEVSFKATGSDIVYNKLNKAIFNQHNKDYDNINNRIIFVKGLSIKYYCENRIFTWQIVDYEENPDHIIAHGESDTLENCKKDFCGILNNLRGGRTIKVSDFEVPN